MDEVVTFATEVLFEWKRPTSTSRRRLLANELTCEDQVNLKSFSTLSEKEAITFLISSLTKGVMNSPNKSTMTTDVINNYSQEKQKESMTIMHHIKIQKLMLNKMATWSDMIEDRVQCQICLGYHRPGEACSICGHMLQRITEEVKKQAEQRIRSRFIMYFLDE